ncbi:MAG: epimerase, partial [Chitinophagaceae bacterium]|nr:epimerase [Chitinophagaceae bacterium]
MTGGILLQLCLDSFEVKEVVSLVREKTNQQHPKLTEIVLDDFTDYTS